jgi:hypothetical protein
MNYQIPTELKLPCVIYYHSEDCGVCSYTSEALGAIIDNPEYNDITFLGNVYAENFNVKTHPAFVLVDKNGNVAVHTGYENYYSLRLKLNTLI